MPELLPDGESGILFAKPERGYADTDAMRSGGERAGDGCGDRGGELGCGRVGPDECGDYDGDHDSVGVGASYGDERWC